MDGSSGTAARVRGVVTPIFEVMAVLAAAAGCAIVVLIGASVTMRYLAFAPFRFTEELVGLLMTAAFFLALPLATLRSEHVRVLIFVSALPGTTRKWIAGLAAVFGVVFSFWFLLLSLPWLEFAVSRGIKSEVGRLILYPWMALIPLSMFASILAFLLADPQEPGRSTGTD